MVQYCVVPGCRNNALIRGIRFHLFPKCPRLKKMWEIKIRRDSRYNKPISSTMRICSEHFTESDYREVPTSGRMYLKSDAVPSVFSFDIPPKPRKKRIAKTSFPQEKGSVAIKKKMDSSLVIDKPQNFYEECLYLKKSLKKYGRTVSKENTSAEIQEENGLCSINKDQCNERCLEASKAISAEENVKVEIEEEDDSYSQINEYLEVSMAVCEENVNVEIQEENNLDLVTGVLCNEKSLEVTMAVSEENDIVELDNKLLEERVKKLEEELAAVKSENSTLRSLVAELTSELLKYKSSRKYP